MRRKIKTYAIAQTLVIEHPIEYPEGYSYFKYADIIREIFRCLKGNSDAYISPTRIDKVCNKADATIKLEHDIKILNPKVLEN